ncbi:MAG: amidohydrolase [Gemmatimonadota bacterium]
MSGRIFIARTIHSLNSETPGAHALVVERGHIRVITTPANARRDFPHFEAVDLAHTTITPGLVDAHIHFLEWAVARSQVDLAHARSIPDAARAAAAGVRTRGWILGRGWNPQRWGGAYPDRAALDALVPDVPVALQSHDMHALWLNTRALESTGIATYDGDPDGGRIVRAADGLPTGVLLENAAQLVVPHLPRYDVATLTPLLSEAQRELHRYGITGLHSFPGVHLKQPEPLSVLQAMRERGELALRVLQHIPLEHLEDAIRLGLRSGFGDAWLRIGGVKMFLDGALGSRTAWMREPYQDSSDCGVRVMPEQDFRHAVRRAASNGIASVVHAIGDAAVELAFAVLSDHAFRVSALPHRIEHVQCLPPDHTRFDERVVCSVQPAHLMTDWRAAERHWGQRAQRTYAFGFMRDHGAVLAFGSDAPVESADPRHGLFAAMARTDLAREPAGGWHPSQRLSARAALAGYVLGPARCAGIPAARSGLVPGALADFVAWPHDPLSLEPAELLALEPVATVVGGNIVFGD